MWPSSHPQKRVRVNEQILRCVLLFFFFLIALAGAYTTRGKALNHPCPTRLEDYFTLSSSQSSLPTTDLAS